MRWIVRLPADMPNMDVQIPETTLKQQFGSQQQLFHSMLQNYKSKATYSAMYSVILSYLATILKALLNAIWWLGRGPYDSVTVAKQSREKSGETCGYFWWLSPWVLSPFVHGTSEGTYRALAELVGNTTFGAVLIFNGFRQMILGTARPRAQSLLDGFVLGVQGLMLDTFVTPFQQLVVQTQVAHQDWGAFTAILVLFFSLARLPLGPGLGLLHFAAASCEGLASVLLHEEAQFAPFEAQRTVESESVAVELGSTLQAEQSAVTEHLPWRESPWPSPAPEAAGAQDRTVSGGLGGLPTNEAPAPRQPNRRWRFREKLANVGRSLTRMLADDDLVMDHVQMPMQYALNP